MMDSSVLERRVSNEELLRYNECPIKEFTCYVVDSTLNLIGKFSVVVDITEKNFREVAVYKCKELFGNSNNYSIRVNGKSTNIILNSEILTEYKIQLCKTLDYDNGKYKTQLNSSVVRMCMSDSGTSDFDRVVEKSKLSAPSSEELYSDFLCSFKCIDYSGFGGKYL